MSILLELAILKGSTLADFTKAMAEVSAEHPEMKLDMAHGSYHTYADGTGILFAEGTDGDEPLAKALSEKLGRSVMLLYVYDETQWGYFLYENGRALDAFSPIVPEQFTGDPSEIERYKGNAQLVAEHFGVSVQAVERYLVRWTKELLQDGGKAYPSDTYPYGEGWQMGDFMNALRHPYAFEPVEDAPPPAPAPEPAPAAGQDYFAQWLQQEEKWIAAYRRKCRKTLLLLVLPLVIGFLVAFLVCLGLVEGRRGAELLDSAVAAVKIGLLVTLPIYWYVMHRLSKGRLSKAIQKAIKWLGVDIREQQTLGMQMLGALQSPNGCLDYLDTAANSQKAPARLLVSGDYFYQTGSGMNVLLLRRKDVEYIEAGEEKKWRRVSSGVSRLVPVYTVYFYFRSSRGERLEGEKRADCGIGFFDRATRDRVYTMIDRQMKSPVNQ